MGKSMFWAAAALACAAAVPLPTADQVRYQQNEIMALVHYNMATSERPGRKSKRAAAPPRLRRGHSVETSRGAAAAATWTFRGDEYRAAGT